MTALAIENWFPVERAQPSLAYTRRRALSVDESPSATSSGSNERLLGAIRTLIAAFRESETPKAVVSAETVENALRFQTLLPADMPPAEAYISQFGSICFDWDENKENILSVMIQKDRRIGFAAYFSGDRVHGTMAFVNGAIPDQMALAVTRWRKNARNART